MSARRPADPQSSAQSSGGGSELERAVRRHLRYSLGQDSQVPQPEHLYRALALTVRELAIERLLQTERRLAASGAKQVYYLSLEFLIGRSLANNLINLGLYDEVRAFVASCGLAFDDVLEAEHDAALGNGGLGRLAACFLDSLATLGLPGFGYGINYDYGLFKQELDNGYQRERPDHWLRQWSPWQIERSDELCLVPVYGRIDHGRDRDGRYNPMWLDWQVLVGLPFDMPVIGYGGRTVNYLRLYSARASDEFDMQIFSQGDYLRAVEEKIRSETISKVLYPPDTVQAGKELRLLQEYFFVFCALHDIVRRFQRHHASFERFPDQVAIQLNDTHPALAITELMRLLIDEHDLEWDAAWKITQRTFGYTNHTLLPEALEQWPVTLLERLVPRHLQIAYEINRRFLARVAELWPQDPGLLRRVSLVHEGDEKRLRMAHLALVGSHSVNGVARLHSELLRTTVLADFHRIWPERFNNKTNGVTPRRWLLLANPQLATLITDAIGDGWITDLDALRQLEPLAAQSAFRQAFLAVKQHNKERLAATIAETAWVKVDPRSMFDIQAKRIHEYKRQLLNLLHIVYRYLRLVDDGDAPTVPRTHIFAGKAAPGYWAAKQVIKCINNVARQVNKDPRTRGLLRVVFVPDYRVSLAERIIPGADLSEQISTAGTEASGTGNMKFGINGALTIGTLDGANIEMLEEVGRDNIFIFGQTTAELAALRRDNSYQPRRYYERDDRIRRVLDALASDRFCADEPGLLRWVRDALLDGGDPYFLLADFAAYVEAQERAEQRFAAPERWAESAILNVARLGKFSSDRTVLEYAREIWGVEALEPMPHGSDQPG
ncbi:MAG: glycogen/starch/alpha-glucan phosphorylase [Proteobacteria bacterium]|nr:glycogen/starch/alpha-glucan phosphorylase [Pseudomonadota bacterium]